MYEILKGKTIAKSVYDFLDGENGHNKRYTVYYSDSKSPNDDDDLIFEIRLFWDAKNLLWRLFTHSYITDVSYDKSYTRKNEAVEATKTLIGFLEKDFYRFGAKEIMA